MGTYRAEDDDGGGATLPPQALVAQHRIATEGGAAAPMFGERVAYVVGIGAMGSRLGDRCVEPQATIEGNAGGDRGSRSLVRIDRWWYAEKALLPAIVRVFHDELCGLPPCDAASWLREVPRPRSLTFADGANTGGPLVRFLQIRRSCPGCGRFGFAAGGGSRRVCRECASEEDRRVAWQQAQVSTRAAQTLEQTCVLCAGDRLWRACAAAGSCPILGRRVGATLHARQAAEDARCLGAKVNVEEAVVLSSDSEEFEVKSSPRPRGIAYEADTHEQPHLPLPDISNGASIGFAPFDISGPRAGHSGYSEGGIRVGSALYESLQGQIAISDDEDESAASNVIAPLSFSHGKPSFPVHMSPSSFPCCSGHGEPCRKVLVRKEGPNHGRAFFACSRPRETQCDFFAWCDSFSDKGAGGESPPSASSLMHTGAGAIPAQTSAQSVLLVTPPPSCVGHGEPCRVVEVRKEGPNQGRRFFACPRPREEQCKQFAWADKPTLAALPSAAPASTIAVPPSMVCVPTSAAPAELAPAPGTPPPRVSRAAAVASTAGSSKDGGGALPPESQDVLTPRKQPAKRPRTSSTGMRDGRLERYVEKPSKKVLERIARALVHRLFLIRVEVDEKGAITAAVLGHTGNVYDVTLSARVACTCPDFGKARCACKHLLFVLLRVMQLPQDDPRVWQRALLPREVHDLRQRLQERLNGANDSVQLAGIQASSAVLSAFEAAGRSLTSARGSLPGPCLVCFEAAASTDGVASCSQCGQTMHRHCLMQCSAAAENRQVTCPRCRALWPVDDEVTNARNCARGSALSPLNLSAYSEAHQKHCTLEETYPDTHQWIAKRNGSLVALDTPAASLDT